MYENGDLVRPGLELAAEARLPCDGGAVHWHALAHRFAHRSHDGLVVEALRRLLQLAGQVLLHVGESYVAADASPMEATEV